MSGKLTLATILTVLIASVVSCSLSVLPPSGTPDEVYTATSTPENLSASVDYSARTVNLTWDETEGASYYNVYFQTETPVSVSCTVHVEDERIPDFTATAADASGQAYTTSHELQLIGLVPGEVNEVTLKLRGSWGNVRQTIRFTIEMPETHSGYDTLLDHTDGESGEALDDGLFTMMRTNGYLGYGFLYDNAGVMRYEMVLEGFGLDRILFYDKAAGDEIVTCVSSNKLARMNGLGEVLQVYPLGDYELHHDIDYGPDGKVVALAEKAGDANVEDIVLEVDLATGEVTELLDFKKLMAGYYEQTRPIGPTDPFFWQAGEQDWIHLNTIQYLPDSDSLVVSSRETSTVIKAENVHGEASIGWLCGDPAFWQGTGYEGYCLAPTCVCSTTTTGPCPPATTTSPTCPTPSAPTSTATAAGRTAAMSTSTASTRRPAPSS